MGKKYSFANISDSEPPKDCTCDSARARLVELAEAFTRAILPELPQGARVAVLLEGRRCVHGLREYALGQVEQEKGDHAN
jgi:hypothetical protein